MNSTVGSASASKASLWTGRAISGVVALLLLFDGITKLLRVPQAVDATIRIGFPVRTIVGIGITLLVCTAIYAVPKSSILGVILLTGYLGGAIAAQLRSGSPVFETLFPVIFGVLAWLGLYLREQRLRALLPLRNTAEEL